MDCLKKKARRRDAIAGLGRLLDRFDLLPFSLVAIYFAIFKLFCIPKGLQQGLKLICIIFVLIYLLYDHRNRDYRNAILPFCFAVVVSSTYGYVAGYISFSNFLYAPYYAICLYALMLLVADCSKRKRMGTFIDVFLLMTAVYCALSAFSIAWVGVADGTLLYYFAGNKFSTSYFFILLTCLAYMKMAIGGVEKRVGIPIAICLGILSLFVSLEIYCSTAAVMSVLVIVLILVPTGMQKALSRPPVIVVSMLLTGAVLAFLAQLLQMPIIQYVVVDVLGESLTLTGREPIYDALQAVILESPIVGHGYGNAAVAAYVGYGNAQNSIMETVVNYGLLGLGSILLMVWVVSKSRKPAWAWGAFILLYAMILGSVVEVTYGYFFFVALAIIGAASDDGCCEDYSFVDKSIRRFNGEEGAAGGQ